MTLTIGADPELFVSNGIEIVSGIGFVGGSKRHPRPVPCGAVQEDNVLAEFNIDPASNVGDFLKYIATVTSALDDILGENGLHTVCQSSNVFDRQALLDAGHKALEFGCDPDFNSWTHDTNQPPNPYTELRTAGGHVHIGYDNPTEERSYEVACILDYLLGAPSVLLDNDKQRRSMYGGAGACRLKEYGVEYRVLSNFWIATESLQTWVFNITCLIENLTLDDFSFMEPEELFEIINSSDEEGAAKLVDLLTANIAGFYMP